MLCANERRLRYTMITFCIDVNVTCSASIDITADVHIN